jgi:hypothetical protein
MKKFSKVTFIFNCPFRIFKRLGASKMLPQDDRIFHDEASNMSGESSFSVVIALLQRVYVLQTCDGLDVIQGVEKIANALGDGQVISIIVFLSHELLK